MKEVPFEQVEVLSPDEAALVHHAQAVLGYRVEGAKEHIPLPTEDGKLLLGELAIAPIVECLVEGQKLWQRALDNVERHLATRPHPRFSGHYEQLDRLKMWRAENQYRLVASSNIIRQLMPTGMDNVPHEDT